MPAELGQCPRRGVGAIRASQTVENEKVPRVPEERGGQVALMEERNQASRRTMISAEVEAGAFQHAKCVLLVAI